MTIIIAQKTMTGVLLAADNYSHDGTRRTLRATPKLVQVSPRVAYGTSGHTRVANILRERINDFPKPLSSHPKEDDYEQYEMRLGAFFRSIVKDEYPETKVWALVAVDDLIFDVGPDGGLIRVADPFTAGGEAELVALGALHAVNEIRKDNLREAMPLEFKPGIGTTSDAGYAIGLALDACASFIDSIRPPWSFVETTKPTTSNAT